MTEAIDDITVRIFFGISYMGMVVIIFRLTGFIAGVFLIH
jgi:F0F1-type ATP synthase assembly protein I